MKQTNLPRRSVILLLAVAAVVGCDFVLWGGTHELRVVDASGHGIPQAMVGFPRGNGVHALRADEHGVVDVPDAALGGPGWIVATAYFPQDVAALERRTYRLEHTPLTYVPLMEFQGTPLLARQGTLQTVDGSGVVRRYYYGPGGGGESEAAATFAPGYSVTADVVGDTLWLRGQMSGDPMARLRAYLLHDDAAPELLDSLSVPGARWFLRRDSLLVVDQADPGRVRVLVAVPGRHYELASLETGGTMSAYLFGDVVVVRLYATSFRVVLIDLAAAGGPAVVGQRDLGAFDVGVQRGDSLLLAPATPVFVADASVTGSAAASSSLPGGRHVILDMRDPLNPLTVADADVPAWASDLLGPDYPVGPDLALGTVYTTNVLLRTTDWSIVATLSESVMPLWNARGLRDGTILFIGAGGGGWAFGRVFPVD